MSTEGGTLTFQEPTFPSTLGGNIQDPGFGFLLTQHKGSFGNSNGVGYTKAEIALHTFRPHLDTEEAEPLPPPPIGNSWAVTLPNSISESRGSCTPAPGSPHFGSGGPGPNHPPPYSPVPSPHPCKQSLGLSLKSCPPALRRQWASLDYTRNVLRFLLWSQNKKQMALPLRALAGKCHTYLQG